MTTPAARPTGSAGAYSISLGGLAFIGLLVVGVCMRAAPVPATWREEGQP